MCAPGTAGAHGAGPAADQARGEERLRPLRAPGRRPAVARSRRRMNRLITATQAGSSTITQSKNDTNSRSSSPATYPERANHVGNVRVRRPSVDTDSRNTDAARVENANSRVYASDRTSRTSSAFGAGWSR